MFKKFTTWIIVVSLIAIICIMACAKLGFQKAPLADKLQYSGSMTGDTPARVEMLLLWNSYTILTDSTGIESAFKMAIATPPNIVGMGAKNNNGELVKCNKKKLPACYITGGTLIIPEVFREQAIYHVIDHYIVEQITGDPDSLHEHIIFYDRVGVLVEGDVE